MVQINAFLIVPFKSFVKVHVTIYELSMVYFEVEMEFEMELSFEALYSHYTT